MDLPLKGYWLLIYFSLLQSTLLLAQTDSAGKFSCLYSFAGLAVDGETEEVLPGAVVHIKELNIGTLADAQGRFEFKNLCKGNYQIECHFTGYKSIFKELFLKDNTFKQFVLHNDSCALESVVVVGKRREKEATVATIELKGQELERTRGLSLGESLKFLPGINSLQTGPTIYKPVIQGLHSNRVLIITNGIRLESQQWGIEHAPEVDPYTASKISIIKGAMGVRYGSEAIGGVILIEPKPLRKDPGLGGEINLAGFSNNRQGVASGIVDYYFKNIPGLSTRLQGTLKRGGNIKTPDYFLSNTGFKEYNFSWATGLTKKKYSLDVFYSQFNNKLGIFSGAHIEGLTDLNNAITRANPTGPSEFTYQIKRPYQQVMHELFKIRASYKLPFGKLETEIARQFNDREEFDLHRVNNPNAPQLKLKVTTDVVNVTLEHTNYKNLSGVVGLSGIHQENTWSGRFFIPNFLSYGGGIFAIQRWKKDRLELEGGIRYDARWLQVIKWSNENIISPEYLFQNISGTIGGIYDISENIKLKSNLGTSFRPPSVNELYSKGFHHGDASYVMGDSTLQPERAYNINLTFQFNFNKLGGEINFYHNYIHNYINLVPTPPFYFLSIKGASLLYTYKQVNATFDGVDFTLEDSISKRFLLTSKASLLRAYNLTEKEHLVLTPSSRILNGIKWNLKSREKVLNPYVLFSQLFVARKSKIREFKEIPPPPPGYLLFNLEAGWVYIFKNQPVHFIFSIDNLFNTKYRDYLDRFRFFADAPGRNFSIRIKIPFNTINSKTN